ncbi:hypothetical protein PAPYR_8579 [Paratrimastix pyriformis]|uniref:LicD/FKTN/FKRP nucleotidyltransferase domain-containing protein n=1 Tax=Paratrimastix pyriformis TaxID=342808 RepID=A0ABQ8UAE6_9EUKA|nr:hypothetical protein PAPYR_8579 [Paratrimastix pyriformis]
MEGALFDSDSRTSQCDNLHNPLVNNPCKKTTMRRFKFRPDSRTICVLVLLIAFSFASLCLTFLLSQAKSEYARVSRRQETAITTLKFNLQAAQTNISDLSRQRDQLSDDLTIQARVLDDLVGNFTRFRSMVKDQTDTINLSLQSKELDLAKAQDLLALVQDQLETTRTELNSAKTQLLFTQTQFNSAKTQLAASESNLTTAKTQLAASESGLTTAKTQLAASESNLAKAKTQLAASESGLTKAKTDIIALEQSALPPWEEEPLTYGIPDPLDSFTVPAVVYLPPGTSSRTRLLWYQLNAGFAVTQDSQEAFLLHGGVMVPAGLEPLSLRQFPFDMPPGPGSCVQAELALQPKPLVVCRPGAAAAGCDLEQCSGTKLGVRTFLPTLGSTGRWMNDEMAYRLSAWWSLRLGAPPVVCPSGTLLGIQRHHGNIPWDDDVDFNIFQASLPLLQEAKNLAEFTQMGFNLSMNPEVPTIYRISIPGRPAIKGQAFTTPYMDVFPLEALYPNTTIAEQMTLIRDFSALRANQTSFAYTYLHLGVHGPWKYDDIFPIRYQPYNYYYLPVPHNLAAFMFFLGPDAMTTCLSRPHSHLVDMPEPEPRAIRRPCASLMTHLPVVRQLNPIPFECAAFPPLPEAHYEVAERFARRALAVLREQQADAGGETLPAWVQSLIPADAAANWSLIRENITADELAMTRGILHTQYAVPLVPDVLPNCMLYAQVIRQVVGQRAVRRPFRSPGDIWYLHSLVCDRAPDEPTDFLGHLHFFGLPEIGGLG